MKLARVPDPAAYALGVDLRNQLILMELATTDSPTAELSRRLGAPGAAVWKKDPESVSLGVAEVGENLSD